VATDVVNRIFAVQWHALRLYRLSQRLERRGHHYAAALLLQIGRILSGIDIVPGAQIGAGTVFIHGHGIVIGAGAVIGENCRIFQQVTVGTHDGLGYPTIGNDVTLYPGAKIIGPITIGDGARVGANAVVLIDVPAGATAVGNPATVTSGHD
jgi:serine O-acetyltransferase